MGVALFATLSDGTHIEPVDAFRSAEAALEGATGDEPKGEVQPQLEEGDGQEDPGAHRPYPVRLPARSLDAHQQEPRGDLPRGSGRVSDDRERGRDGRAAGQTRPVEGRAEQGHPRPGLRRVPPSGRTT